MSQEPPLDSRGDRDLLACFVADGRQEAFAALVRRHGDMVLRVCRARLGNAADAEDAAQAVFLTLARRASSLTRHATLAGWLYRVAWYVAGNAARVRLTRLRHEQEAARMSQPANNPASDVPIPPEALYAGLFALAEKYRLPLILHHLQGKTEAQTAALLGISVSAASVRLSRGRQKLRNQLARMGAGSTVALTAALSAPASGAPASFVTAATQTAASALAGQVVTDSIFTLSQGAIHMLCMAKMKLAALVTAAVMLVGGAGVLTYVTVANAQSNPGPRVAAPQPQPAQSAVASPQVRPGDIAELVKGEKVLISFSKWGAFIGPNPREEDLANARKAVHGEIATAVRKAGAQIVRDYGESVSGAAGREYSAIMLLDCGGRPPEKALADVPHRFAGIVFRDGSYLRGMPVETAPRFRPWIRKGQVPAPHGYKAWGAMQGQQREADLARFGELKGVKAEFEGALPGSGGGGGHVRLKPAPGHTLLEVFLLTETGFEFADPPMNQPAASQPNGGAMAEQVKGEKVLVKFWHYPLVDHPNRPSDDDIATGRKKIGDNIAQALKAANVQVLRFLWGQDGQEGADRSSYSAMVLLDCKSVRPEKALAEVPYRIAGIVFKDGAYERALPVEAESKWLITAKKGQVPARYAFYSRGGSALAEFQQGEQDVERFGKMAELRVQAIPPSGAAGGGWSAKLTPAEGHTLLEVFILTGAGFQLVDPRP